VARPISLRYPVADYAALVEPGYYADGKFGIRIENIIVVRKAQTPNNFGDKGYLGMEVRLNPCRETGMALADSLSFLSSTACDNGD
jgi:hypothetical protein